VDWIYKYSKSFVEGLQGKPQSLSGILGSAKHFFGDGATMYGADEGNTQIGSFKSFVTYNTQGFLGSIEA
jgi:beta-glucosidase